MKYLGVYLDEHLDGSKHCLELEPKLRRLNGMIFKISPFLSTSDLISFYYSIFSSSMLYGCQIWGLTTRTKLRRIEVLQNRAVRTIIRHNEPYKNHFLNHVTPHYKYLGILKLSDAITLKNTILAHDYVNNKLPSSFQHFFTLQTSKSSTNTRNSSKGSLFMTHIHTIKYGKNSVKHKSMMAWNKMISTFPQKNLKNLSRNGLKALAKNSILNEYAV